MKNGRERIGKSRAAGTSIKPHRARKRFGQHFLERSWADKVLRAIGPSDGDVFLEVGPGQGALTRPLADRVRRIIAFEIDRDLASALRQDGAANVTVVEGDFLGVTSADILGALASSGDPMPGALKVAGNLPFNVATPILFKCLELYRAGLPLVDAVIMVQKEVSDRIMARPGTHDYGVLSVLLRREADLESLLALPPGAFRPPPQVRSALLRLRFHRPHPEARDEQAFQALVRAVFTRRRKMLANALAAYNRPVPFSAVDALDQADIDPRRRPETLDLDEFVRLSDAIVDQPGG